MSYSSHYPGYDVLEEKHEWDDHTRGIVLNRLNTEHEYQFLEIIEIETLQALCAVLLDDSRAEIVQYILKDIDHTLSSTAGEGQRKPGVPPQAQLVRQGLKDMNEWSLIHHKKYFFNLEQPVQQQLVQLISHNQAEPQSLWNVPQKDLFNKLLSLVVERYCSHPCVWSEIGYGGPAYPRGYVRVTDKELDPWEAKKKP